MRLCRLFLENYVKYTTKTIVVLGPEETKKVRAVNSAATVTQCWRELIAKADGTVLEKKRNAEPSRRHFWQLAFKDHTNQRARGPVFEISRVRVSSSFRREPILIVTVDLSNPCAKV